MQKKLSLLNVASIGLPLLLGSVNLLVSILKAGPGFPLDDAWIHQTFARNFALTGVWTYQSGSSSGGSTSPLWTLLLASTYWIKGIQPYIGTFILGIGFFVLLVWIGSKSVAALTRDSKNQKIPVLLWIFVAATAWQLIWAAGSGMETTIYSALIMAVFYFAITQRKGWIWFAGILTGIGVWIRPDAFTLMGPIGLILVLSRQKPVAKLKGLAEYILGAALPIAGYLVWNLVMSGELFPNTFYAKQAEYAVLLNQPLFIRVLTVFIPLFAGVNLVLLPGIFYSAWRSLRTRSFTLMAILLWCLGYGLIYALRLPVSYQHGRYMMPILAPLMLLGTIGTYELMSKLFTNKARVSWVLGRAWIGCTILITVIFLFQGIGQYTYDVRAINQLMVASAKWVAANTQPSDVIAVHDIGAMGYFGQRKIIDLAGLINPEIIPFMRNEQALASYLSENDAAYLVILKNWYPLLERKGSEAAQFRFTSENDDQTMLIRKLE